MPTKARNAVALFPLYPYTPIPLYPYSPIPSFQGRFFYFQGKSVNPVVTFAARPGN